MSTFLIVDDDRTARLLIAQIVVRNGHQYIAASDGKRALEVLKDNPQVDVIITDMQMPNMRGDELVAKIRTDAHWQSTPIIMVSGFVQTHEVKDLLKSGVDRFVPKPIDTHQIGIYINDMADQSKEQQSTDAA
ncbi:MAG TPA: two-component system response regulator [Phycisphaerales bacterium]|nr:two-component system response regulator [Phycisphaerales bacterium]|tara:strand:- start:553 stop:951 length:399 start_codon:yes stop_codon:yes gene_type:complete